MARDGGRGLERIEGLSGEREGISGGTTNTEDHFRDLGETDYTE